MGVSRFSELSRTHPFRFSVESNDLSEQLLVYFWNITYGGKGRAPNEFRIQITVSGIQQTQGVKTLLLGWDDKRQVFAGFNARRYHTVGRNPSVQVKEEFLLEARDKGLSIQIKEQDESENVTNMVIAFRQEFLIPYILKLNSYHWSAPSSLELMTLKKTLFKEISDNELEKLPYERKRALRETNQLLRDHNFRNQVLTAYDFQCAVCGVKLGIVEAAHIVPIKDGGTDETCNGIALCPNHHMAFDKGIMLIDENYIIHLNETELERLDRRGCVEGLEKFKLVTPLGESIKIVDKPENRPKRDYLRKKTAQFT